MSIAIMVSAGAGFFTSAMHAHAGIFNDLFGSLFQSASTTTSSERAVVPLYKPTIDYEQAIVHAIEQASPAVISIIISKDLPVIENCPVDPFNNLPQQFRDFFGPFEFQQPCQKGTKRQEVGGGSGFIVSKNGLIVTNKHVVADEKASYTVLLNDGEKLEAQVVARDPVQDLAIIKIKASHDLPIVIFGNSDAVKLGQTAIAIGNALGEFRNTVSAGIISGLARSIDAGGTLGTEHLEGLIQTDAAINPGNSGGPLLNLRGEVVAINTAIAEGAQNIGFAIPVNQVKRDLESVERSGKISVPFLGVRYLLITEDLMRRDKLSVAEGVILRGNDAGPAVIAGSPAEKAGLAAEDIILALNGEKITAGRSLSSLIEQYQAGDTVKLTILRGGKELMISVTLAERKV